MDTTTQDDSPELTHVRQIIEFAKTMITETVTRVKSTNTHLVMPIVYINKNIHGIPEDKGVTLNFFKREPENKELQSTVQKEKNPKIHNKERTQKSGMNVITPMKTSRTPLATNTNSEYIPPNFQQIQETAKTPTQTMSDTNIHFVPATQNPYNQYPPMVHQVAEPTSYDTATAQPQAMPQSATYQTRHEGTHPQVVSIPENTTTHFQSHPFSVQRYDNISPQPRYERCGQQNQTANASNQQPTQNHNIHMRPSSANQYIGHQQQTTIKLEPRTYVASDSFKSPPVTSSLYQEIEHGMEYFQ